MTIQSRIFAQWLTVISKVAIGNLDGPDFFMTKSKATIQLPLMT